MIMGKCGILNLLWSHIKGWLWNKDCVLGKWEPKGITIKAYVLVTRHCTNWLTSSSLHHLWCKTVKLLLIYATRIWQDNKILNQLKLVYLSVDLFVQFVFMHYFTGSPDDCSYSFVLNSRGSNFWSIWEILTALLHNYSLYHIVMKKSSYEKKKYVNLKRFDTNRWVIGPNHDDALLLF